MGKNFVLFAILGYITSSFGADCDENGFCNVIAPSVDSLRLCHEDLKKLIDEENCGPIMIRLAWHDSGTFDATVDGNKESTWPKAGGANGSIRFEPEINHGANAGLRKALDLLAPLKSKYPLISWADLMQMASATSVESMGGPSLPMRYGRIDVESPEQCAPEGNLPAGNPPFPAPDDSPHAHLRRVFYRQGFSDQEIVALSGAHTVGRARHDRSGAGAETSKFTAGPAPRPRHDGKPGYGHEGGSSWTTKWLSFDNSYFTTLLDKATDPELLQLATDATLVDDPLFRPFVEQYAQSQEKFFEDYAKAHVKLSENGALFSVPGGISI